MKAAYLQNNHIHVGEVPDPVPSTGQALMRTHTCGLCAADAHFLHGGDAVVEMSHKFGGPCAKLDIPNAQSKRLKINFAAGEEQQDLDLALRLIADGKIDITSWLGGVIGLTGVADALHAMSSPAAPVRTVVDPLRM